jgi:hypothetical protein
MANTSKTAAQVRVARAWTLTKTLLPDAPHTEQVKFAKILLGASTPALKVALKQTAINAHWTRVAEQYAKVHSKELNDPDLFESPSELKSAESAVAAELKGDPKNATTKKADDRKEAGPLPTEYPEPKRTEPAELDGSKAADGRPSSWTEGPGAKEAKKAEPCGKDCKGCKGCKKDAKKAAAAKVAEEAAEKVEGKPEEKRPEEPAKAEGEAAADEAAAEGADAAAEGAEAVASEERAEENGDKPEETFDPAKTKLEEAAADLERDNDKLQDAIAELEGQPSDLDIPSEGDQDLFADGGEFTFDDGFGGEVPADDEGAGLDGGGGEELNLDSIFDPEKMGEKVSALNNEGEEIDIQFGGDEDFFKPSDPAELESVLEQEEDLTSPAQMFALDGVDDDPMARIFASAKQAADDGPIVEPGKIVNKFESSHGPDDRDADNDHEDSIFEEVLRSLKQPTRNDSRDTEAHLKPPAKGGKEASAPIRSLRPIPGKTAGDANLASLLFTDESDYL